MNRYISFSIVFLLFSYNSCFAQVSEKNADVIVYGGTAGGVTSAIAASREGAKVILIEPGQHLGGMLTGGLSHTDYGDRSVIGGLALEFYKKVAHYYRTDLYFWRGPEPTIGENILKQWLKEEKVEVVYGKRLKNVVKSSSVIAKIEMLEGESFTAKVFVDATYDGDLMAKAGVSYTVGREGISKYDEAWAGRQPFYPDNHNFRYFISPFKKGNFGELLPLINQRNQVGFGEADSALQAYCFRLIMTNNPSNRVPILKPIDYDSNRYELLRRYIKARKPTTLKETGIFSPNINLPNQKAEINSAGPISTNLYDGSNWAYPDANYEMRDKIWKDHLNYTNGLLYFAGNDLSLSESIRKEAKEWGLCKDEFADTKHFPHQLYIRVSRRMIGEYVLTSHDLEKNIYKFDGIGMGSYNMDIRHNQRTFHWVSRFPELIPETINEGYISIPVLPYEIPYRSLIPKYEECSNLIVPVCISSSNLAYSSFRMEPQYMIAGHAAGIAAAMSSKAEIAVQQIPINELRARLEKQNQIISLVQNPNGFFQDKNIIVADDDVPRFIEKTGNWKLSEDPLAKRHQITFMVSSQDSPSSFFYRPILQKKGIYKVYGWWPKTPNAATNVSVKIFASTGIQEIEIDQKNNGDDWVLLGIFPLNEGHKNLIEISNTNANGIVIADAFKFELDK
jgi:hypothetical protein